MNNPRHTLIEELPDLEDLDNSKPGLSMLPDNESGKFQKFIRPTNNNHTPPQAGMNIPKKNFNQNNAHHPQHHPQHPQHPQNIQMQKMQQYYQQYMQNQNQYVQNQFPYDQPQMSELTAPDVHQDPPPASYYERMRRIQNHKVYSPENYRENEQEYYEPYEKLSDTSSSTMCPDVLKHAEECNVCSKLYKHDKTPYWLAIIFLTIICILLFKRVLEM